MRAEHASTVFQVRRVPGDHSPLSQRRAAMSHSLSAPLLPVSPEHSAETEHGKTA